MSALVRRWLAPLIVLLLVALFWEVWVRVRDTPTWLLPPPSDIGKTLWDDRTLLWDNAWVTAKEVALGFLLALVAGILLAIVIDASVIAERALYPIVIASQTIPIFALAPLMLIWFGYGLMPKVLITALIGFFPIVVTMVDGLRGTDRELLQLLRALGAGRWTRFRLAKWPSSLPHLFSGARVAITVCVIGAVFGELIASSAGLGYLMRRASAQQLTARVFASIVVLSLLGIALFAIVGLIERLALPWRRYVAAEE
jgi:ABC-type nitrate/sulfonate/bicarbonate transport system permease component